MLTYSSHCDDGFRVQETQTTSVAPILCFVLLRHPSQTQVRRQNNTRHESQERFCWAHNILAFSHISSVSAEKGSSEKKIIHPFLVHIRDCISILVLHDKSQRIDHQTSKDASLNAPSAVLYCNSKVVESARLNLGRGDFQKNQFRL